MLALAFVLAAATTDPTLFDVERAFQLLHDPKQHARARAALVRATARFDDQSLDGSDLEKAFASDVHKPWRGRPHERVLAHVVLAALEMERGRCDLALPSLKSAAFYDAKANAGDDTDAVVVHALTLRCLRELGDAADDAAAQDAAKHLADDVKAIVLDPQARLVLEGRGPTVERRGAQGEDVVVVARSANDGVNDDKDDEDDEPAVIRLGMRAARGAFDLRGGVVVWDSLQQATTVSGRPFSKVLAERARFKSNNQSAAQQNLAASQSQLRGGDVVKAAGNFGFGAGFAALAAATDARADDRCVDALPGTLRLVAPSVVRAAAPKRATTAHR